ncbi:STAS domain-containing protein [Streptomyces cyaneofuscatus]|uniref:STAS domain-containing protein n=2 Tax=Streptomyces TaxID=1883 RepID=UPI0004CC0197|nr:MULTISPECIES: STAS domain-containing protein [Streptomyces]ONI55298.1 RsbT co-antagonist protein RsbRA [Streptomyces sp. IB2014 011-1]RDV53728.1 STAS domain-containing protein [Streptomyces sp. IB2014 011-12]CAD5952438.1 RsbR, positive regulator of sigma-B [Streptomyces sp. KY70]CAD5983506.1 RsbR, positive regulator of sigma-B [Streptomyces sp. KY75]
MAKQDSKNDLAGLLSADRERVVDQWIDSVVGSLKGRISKAEVDRELRELYAALVEALAAGGEDARGDNLSETRALLTELSRNRARQGFTPGETAISVLALKKAFEPALRDGTAEDTDRYLRLSRILDDLALFTIETYTRTREEIISSQAAQLMELSTPVVKLWDGVIAVPLVGTLDSARTQVVMEKLLQALVDTGSEQAIIDITGVPAVDTQVAQHLLKTIVAARLMGAECTVSGIRPQIAQTIVALGIEFGDIVTKATLADALQLALKKSGIDLVAHQGGGR